MQKIIPTITSAAAGPLGVIHLPRLWLKSLLSATGQLADGYKDIGPGYDHMVLIAIGINPDAAREFIAREKPTYAAFEKWIAAQPGARLDVKTVDASNAAVLAYQHSIEVRNPILAEAGYSESIEVLDAVTLNMLDDLTGIHAAVTK